MPRSRPAGRFLRCAVLPAGRPGSNHRLSAPYPCRSPRPVQAFGTVRRNGVWHLVLESRPKEAPIPEARSPRKSRPTSALQNAMMRPGIPRSRWKRRAELRPLASAPARPAPVPAHPQPRFQARHGRRAKTPVCPARLPAAAPSVVWHPRPLPSFPAAPGHRPARLHATSGETAAGAVLPHAVRLSRARLERCMARPWSPRTSRWRKGRQDPLR